MHSIVSDSIKQNQIKCINSQFSKFSNLSSAFSTLITEFDIAEKSFLLIQIITLEFKIQFR